MSVAEKRSGVDLYLASLSKTRSWLDYEKAKVWFYDNYPEASDSDYSRFIAQVADRLNI